MQKLFNYKSMNRYAIRVQIAIIILIKLYYKKFISITTDTSTFNIFSMLSEVVLPLLLLLLLCDLLDFEGCC